MNSMFNSIYEQSKKIEHFDKNAFFEHPLFGVLNKKDTMKFLKMHTTHHLKIIQDISKKNSYPK